MKLEISRKQAFNLSIAVVTARLFTHMVIDGNGVGNSAWICIIAGTILTLPLAIAADTKRGAPGTLHKAALVITFIAGIYEASAVLGLITDTIKCSGMLRASSVWIAAMTLGGCVYAAMKNADGLCNAVRIWIYAFLFLLAVVVIAQLRLYRPTWLLPILGPGVRKIAGGTISAAGIASTAPLIYMLSDDTDSGRACCVKSLVISGIAAAALCALRYMMAPVMTGVDMSRFLAINMLIANGRESLSLQLPLLLAVYGGYISSIAGYFFMAAMSLQRIFTKMSGRICALITAACVYAVNVSGIAGQQGIIAVLEWKFVISALAILAFTVKADRKGRAAV